MWPTREKELQQLSSEVSSARDSVYVGKGIVVYYPEAVGFSSEAAKGFGALDLDANNQEDDSTMDWDDKRLEEDSVSGSGK